MVIATKESGHVEIDEKEIITFSRPIYGFEGAVRYVLLKDMTKEDNPFMWLQCVEKPEPCFAVVDPFALFQQYKPVVSDEDKATLGLADHSHLRYLVIASVPANLRDLSFNLKCPIVINARQNIAIQLIMERSDYSMRHYLFDRVGG